MKRTTIFVSESLERDLQLHARRAGKPTAVVVREALAAYLEQNRPPAALPSFAAAFDSGFTDTAERHEDILFRRVSPHGDAPLKTRKSSRRRAASRR